MHGVGASAPMGKETFGKLLPTLYQTETPTTQATTLTTPTQETDLAALIAAITTATNNAAAALAAATSTTAKDTAKLMSSGELTSLLCMCGVDENGTIDELPQWMRDCADKGNTEAFKTMQLQKHVMATTYYDDVNVPLTAPLLKMMVKRAWTGKDGNINRLSLLHAMDGLNLFAMIDLNKDQVARLNEEQDLLNTASLVSVADLRGQQGKLKASILVEPEDFMLMLKRYANLLYTLFSEE